MECKVENFSLLHHAVFDENYPAIELMRNQLKYFRDIIDEPNDESGWTPLTLAGSQANLPIA